MSRSLGILAGAVVVASVLVAPGAAQEQPEGAVLLILDASGSMNATDDNGVRLIDGAQQALVRLVEVLPEGAPVGLRVYGHRVANTDKANGCLDTELIVPVGPLERESMIDAIGSFSAKGFTPIGLSLEEAASDLPDGRGTIILVSDGEDTCAPPDPCDVATGLAEVGIDVRVHTVGFFLQEEDPARAQLQCIADATGASYRDVDAIDSLTGELGQIVRQSLPGLGNIHLPIAGSLARTAAPLLALGEAPGPPGNRFGAYTATLSPGQAVWYAIELEGPSHVSVSGGLPDAFVTGAQPGDTLDLVITDENGAEVQLWDSGWGQSSLTLSEIDPQRVNFGASTGIGFDGLWAEFEEEDRWVVEVLGYDEESHDAAVRELVRRPEPPRAGPGRYYFGFSWSADAGGDPRSFDFLVHTWPLTDSSHLQYLAVEGSAEAAGAPELGPTQYARAQIHPGPSDGWLQGGYLATLQRGSTMWYSVPVQRDEALSVRAFLNRPEGASATVGETFSVALYDRDMQLVTQPYNDREPTLALDDPSTLDVSFLPRGLAPRPLVSAAIPSLLGEGFTAEGLYYVAFTWEGPADGTVAEIEFIVNLHGEIEPGPVDEDPPEPQAAEAPAQAAEEPDEGRGASEWLIPVGLGGLIVAGGGWLLVRRRRDRGT